MRHLYWATLAALSILATGHVQAATLSITNYQLVTSAPAGGTLIQYTYKADLVNTGVPIGGATATVSSTDPYSVRLVPNASVLNFPAVGTNGTVTSTNTFSVLISGGSGLNPSKITWSFQTVVAGPIANPGPNQTASVGSKVTLNGTGSTDPSGKTLSYSWQFTSRPPGSAVVLWNSGTPMPFFTVDTLGTYVIRLTVSNGVASGQASVTVSTSNTAPVANAGPGQTVSVGTLVHLDGSGSTDVDGNFLTYHWTLTSAPTGSAAALSSTTIMNPTFTVDLPGTYTAQLIVNDGLLDSQPSNVTISTSAAAVPTAFAGNNQTVAHNTTVQLNGSGTDPQGKPLTFQWALIGQPGGSTATLSNAIIPNPTFLADKPGTYVAQLTVSNGIKVSDPSTVTITTTNTAPVANAGPNQIVGVGRIALLDGSGSSDADHDPLTYSWSFLSIPDGSTATLSGGNSIVPLFTPDKGGAYVVQLIVNDGFTSSNPSTVTITAPSVVLSPDPLTLVLPSATMNVHITVVAPAGGVTLNLVSANPNVAVVPATVTIAEGKTDGSFQVTPGIGSGSSLITASATGFLSGSATAKYSAPTVTLSPDPLALGSATATMNVHVSAKAPAGGLVLALASSNPAAATVPASVTIAADQQDGSFTVTPGTANGTTNITATATGYSQGKATVNFGGVQITLSPDPLALSTTPLPLTVSISKAQASDLTINIANSDPTVATVPATAVITAGNTSTTITVTPVGDVSGTTVISGSVQYMITGTATVNYTAPPKVVLPATPLVLQSNLQAALPIKLNVPAPTDVIVTLVVDDPSKVYFVSNVNTVTIPAGATTPVTPVLLSGGILGTTKITATSPGLAGAQQTIIVTSQLSFYPTTVTMPYASTSNRYSWLSLASGVAPPGGLTISLTSDDPSVAKAPLTVTIPAGQTQVQVYPIGVKKGTTVFHTNTLPDATLTVIIQN